MYLRYVALLEAVKWLAEHPYVSLICTDSLSVHSALEQNDWKDRDPWLKQIKESIYHGSSQIVLLWIPSHCGIEGNECADKLADEGSKMTMIQLHTRLSKPRSREEDGMSLT